MNEADKFRFKRFETAVLVKEKCMYPLNARRVESKSVLTFAPSWKYLWNIIYGILREQYNEILGIKL